MSFSKGLKVQRSQQGYVVVSHSCGLAVRKSMHESMLDNPRVSTAAFEREMDRLEKTAIEALKNLYAFKFRVTQ